MLPPDIAWYSVIIADSIVELLSLSLSTVVVIAGFLVSSSSPLDYTAFTHEPDEALPSLLHVTAWRKNTPNRIAGTIFVYAVHGRSTRTCAWPLDVLLNSNEQLTEIGDVDTEYEYCLPRGGVAAGLCGNIVLLARH